MCERQGHGYRPSRNHLTIAAQVNTGTHPKSSGNGAGRQCSIAVIDPAAPTKPLTTQSAASEMRKCTSAVILPGMKRWRGRQHRPAGTIVGCYDYQDESGQLLFQVRRHNSKGFFVRSAAGAAWGQDGRDHGHGLNSSLSCRRPLHHLLP